MNMIAGMLNLDRRAVKALRITDPYSLHRVVYSLFDDVREERDKRLSRSSGILFADQGGDSRGRRVLLLADRKPASIVDGKYGEVESRPVPEGYLDNEHYRFKVIVNPTRRDSASRKLVPVSGRDAVAKWFGERAAPLWGFAVPLNQLQVDKIEVLRFKDKSGNPVTISQAHVQGQLRVIDNHMFQESFKRGIGRGRSFGCGLMQVVPIINYFNFQ